MARKCDRAHSNSATGSLHQYCLSRYGAANKDGAMSRDARYPEASAFLRRHTLRQRRDMIERNNSKLRRRAERAIGLCAVAPYSPADPFRRYALTDLIDLPGAIAVRDNARIGHAQSK